MPAGGIMFEEVLKRLCPCYYNPKPEKESFTPPHAPDEKVPSNKMGSFSGPYMSSMETSFKSTNTTATNTITTTATIGDQSIWKGTINLVQPQPIHAFPADFRKSRKKNQKNLLKPPLYWKKATKDLHLEGPPVFQEIQNRSSSRVIKKLKKRKQWRGCHLKHSETLGDLTTVTTPTTVEVQWLKSQSLDSVFSAYPRKKIYDAPCSKIKRKKEQKQKLEMKNLNFSRSHILPDVSHGIISFTAAYFNKKKTFMISIDRLEKLSKKGREGNTYYSVIKLAILPSEKYTKCTKLLANCSNPEVKEDFCFSVKDTNGKVVRLSVFDASVQKQHEAVGHAFLALENIIFDQSKKYRLKLCKWSQPHTYPGSLGLSLRYIEDEDKFTISADRAKNLNLQKDRIVKLNTYVKVTLYSYGEKIKTKKSITVMDSPEPDYSSTFTFQVRKDQIDHSSVAVTVRLKGFVSDLTIGRLNFGPFFYGDNGRLTPWGRVFLKKEFVSHWFRMYL